MSQTSLARSERDELDDPSDQVNEALEKEHETKKKTMSSFVCIEKAYNSAHSSNRRRPLTQKSPFPRLKCFNEVDDENERVQLFAVKISHCCTFMCDFSDPDSDIHNKMTKRNWLLDLLEYLRNTNDHKLFVSQSSYSAVFDLLNANAIRAIPPREEDKEDSLTRSRSLTELDVENIPESSWLHLEVVYHIFGVFVQRTEFSTSLGKKQLDVRFLRHFLSLFDSQDSRERELLRNILHKVYTRFLTLRSLIRREIRNAFRSALEYGRKHQGITELLELLSSIINGFGQPLKDEHKLYLFQALMPLHKSSQYDVYSGTLATCIAQYLRKDNSLAEHVFNELLAIWPKHSGQREVLLISELQVLVEAVATSTLVQVQVDVGQMLLRCLRSPNKEILDQTIELIRCASFTNMLKSDLLDSNRTFALIYRAVCRLLLPAACRHSTEKKFVAKVNECLLDLQALKPEYCVCLQQELKQEAEQQIGCAADESKSASDACETAEFKIMFSTKRKQLKDAKLNWMANVQALNASKGCHTNTTGNSSDLSTTAAQRSAS